MNVRQCTFGEGSNEDLLFDLKERAFDFYRSNEEIRATPKHFVHTLYA